MYNVYNTCVYTYILFQILFTYRLLQNIEYSSLCYTVGQCWWIVLFKTILMRTETKDLIKTIRLANIQINPSEKGERILKAKESIWPCKWSCSINNP